MAPYGKSRLIMFHLPLKTIISLVPLALAGNLYTSTAAAGDPSLDFGDAPDSHKTLLASNGPRHVATGPTLGTERDTEDDAQSPLNGTGDDVSDTGSADDEDGVVFINVDTGATVTSLVPGSMARATITINGGGGNARVYAFVDFNGDEDFDLPDEQVSDGSITFADGSHNIDFLVPANAAIQVSGARFRVSTETGLTADGPAPDGEVEDHLVGIGEGVLNKTTMNEQVFEEVISQEANLNIAGVDSNVLGGIDLTDQQAIINALIAAGVDPTTIVIDVNRRNDGETVTTETDITTTQTPGTIFVGDFVNDPCNIIVILGQLNIMITNTTTTTQFFTDVLTISGNLTGGTCPQPYPDFNGDTVVNSADAVQLIEGLHVSKNAFDLTGDQMLTGDDLLKFSLSWYAEDCGGEQ